MALRLAGEEFSVLQGLDGLGWLREVVASDGDPGLKVNQQGSGRIFDLQDSGVSRMFMEDGGKVLLSRAASPPANPDSLLHLWEGSAGAVAAPGGAVLTIEAAGDAYLSFLTPNSNTQGILFGDPDDVDVGLIEYTHADGRLQIYLEAARRLVYSPGALAFQEATTISTSAGNLALDPASDLDVRSAVKNAGSANGGAVAVDDELRIAGLVRAVSGALPGTVEVELNKDYQATIMRERSAHIADADVAEDYGSLYIYNDGGGTRQLVVKYKDGGTVYTGTVALT